MWVFEWANERVKDFNWLDAKLLAIIGICIGLVLAKLIPGILSISVWWFIAIGVLSMSRIFYVMIIKE